VTKALWPVLFHAAMVHVCKDDELAHDEFDNAGNAETKWLQACRSPPYRV
jgi:hypothetical protein